MDESPTSTVGHLWLGNSARSNVIYTCGSRNRTAIGPCLWSCKPGNFRSRTHRSQFEHTVHVLSTLKRAKQPCSLQIFAFCNCLWVSSSELHHKGHICSPSPGQWAGEWLANLISATQKLMGTPSAQSHLPFRMELHQAPSTCLPAIPVTPRVMEERAWINEAQDSLLQATVFFLALLSCPYFSCLSLTKVNLNELLWMGKLSYCLLTVRGWRFRELYKKYWM